MLLGVALATSTTGLYSLVATLFWGWAFFDVPLDPAHPVWFAVAVPATVLALGLFGLVLAATFILYRADVRAREPLRVPGLADHRAARAAVAAARLGAAARMGHRADVGHQGDPCGGHRRQPRAGYLAAAGVLALAYVALGVVCLRHFERLARRRATLSLT